MIPETAQRNDIGQVALKNLRRRYLAANCNGKMYVFTSWVDIAISWVDEEDVPCLLQKKHQCCGGNRKKIIAYASEDDVRRWTNRGGR